VDELLLDQEAGDTIRFNGKCYYRAGVVDRQPVLTLADLDGCFDDCETCLCNIDANQLIDDEFTPIIDHEGNFISFP
jgi:hypothetical protein